MDARAVRALVLASAAAILVQPFVYVVWGDVPLLPPAGAVSARAFIAMLEWVVVVAGAFVVVVWVPYFLLLRWLGRADRVAVLVGGALLAALPAAIRDWPLTPTCSGCSSSGRWHGHFVQFEANGLLTRYAWLRYAEGVLLFGVHGLVGAFVFYAVWRRATNPTIDRSGRARSSGP